MNINLSKLIICPQCRKSSFVNNITSYVCRACKAEYPIKDGILILVKPKSQNLTIKQWDEKGEFEQLHKRRVEHDRIGLSTSPRIVSLVKGFTKPDSISLDVGCGSGLYTRHFKGAVVSFDIVPFFIKEAARKSKSKRRFFIIADVNDFPFQKGLYNFIFCSQVLEHLNNRNSDLLIKRMKESTRDSLLVDTPNDSNFFSVFVKRILYGGKSHKRGDYHLDHHRKFGIEDLKKHHLEVHGCVGFVTRRMLKLGLWWNVYDFIAWKMPKMGGVIIGIYNKK